MEFQTFLEFIRESHLTWNGFLKIFNLDRETGNINDVVVILKDNLSK